MVQRRSHFLPPSRSPTLRFCGTATLGCALLSSSTSNNPPITTSKVLWHSHSWLCSSQQLHLKQPTNNNLEGFVAQPLLAVLFSAAPPQTTHQ